MDEPLWVVRAGMVPYRLAWAWQRELVARRLAGDLPDVLLLLEHPHVLTIGKRGSAGDVLAAPGWLAERGAEVVQTDRGGQVTYHGPGQLVGYPIVALEPPPDVWRLVGAIEAALIATAGRFGADARGERGETTGVWVGDAKLAAIGMRVSHGVTSHGFALNCATDLGWFDLIVPCGLPGRAACSLSSVLGRTVPVAAVLPLVSQELAGALGREPADVPLGALRLEGIEPVPPSGGLTAGIPVPGTAQPGLVLEHADG